MALGGTGTMNSSSGSSSVVNRRRMRCGLSFGWAANTRVARRTWALAARPLVR